MEIEKTVRKHYLSHKLTPTEESDFQEAQTCNLCLKSLEKNHEQKSETKVCNHCHNTGKYLRAVHSHCSTQYKDDSPHVILAHNSSKFDNHFLIFITNLKHHNKKYTTKKKDTHYLNILNFSQRRVKLTPLLH